MHLLRSSDGEPVNLGASATLGVGGEARIFSVPNLAGMVAKVYHRPTPERAAKLRAMLENSPENPMAAQGHVSIAWPTDLLVVPGSDQVAGFLMPRVTGMGPIIDFYHPKSRRRKHPLFSYRYLLRTARNLAACVGALHHRGCVIGDLNESNILVGETALVTLVDTDSFQVPDPRNGQLHRCRVGKPEFTPAELQSVRFAWVDRRPEHDLFGLAVLIFQLLMEGIHPFAGRYKGRGEPPSLEERIAAGWFPYAPGTRGEILPMPTAPAFELLSPVIRELFLRCFAAGHRQPALRPDAQTWSAALLEAEGALANCQANDQHCYGAHLRACPWCERVEQLEGIDPFQSRERVKRHRHLHPLLTTRQYTPWQPQNYHEAIAIALRAIARQRRGRWLWAIGLPALTALLVIYWVWAIRLALSGQ